MSMDNIYIVFCVEHYNPLGVIRSLGENGIHPVAIVIQKGHRLASKSKYISKLHYVQSVEEGYELLLSQYGNCDETPVIFACDDVTVSYLDQHYAQLSKRFVFFNAGTPGRITQFQNKDTINQLAIKHGLNVLSAVVTSRGVVPKNLEYPVITKAIASTVGGWKDDVFICHNEQELREAYKSIKSETILLQKYIKKKSEYVIEGCSTQRGKNVLFSIASTYNYVLPDRYSSYMQVQTMERKEIVEPLKAMFAEIGFEGIFEVEFLMDDKDQLYFLEINFRNSTWSYASTCAGMPLPCIWATCMLNDKNCEDFLKTIPTPFMAMVETNDFLWRVIRGKLNILKWIHDFNGCKCHYYCNISDMRPVFAMIGSRVQSKIKGKK